MRSVCVFCGSNAGTRPEYLKAARALGRGLVEAGIGLVYGGAGVGLMAEVANACLEAGGSVVGVIPRTLVEKELAHSGLDDLRVVGTMHERKALMADLADGFVALPGGLGTLDEMFEILTWAQLGLHDKPCGLLDVDGYYRHLMAFLDHAVSQGFVHPEHRSMLVMAEEPAELLAEFALYRPPRVHKWIDRPAL